MTCRLEVEFKLRHLNYDGIIEVILGSYPTASISLTPHSFSLTFSASLEIWVSNSNSWTLAFRNSDYRATVQEDAAADTNVLTVDLANRPRDRDIEFCIASGNEMGAFKLLTENGGK